MEKMDGAGLQEGHRRSHISHAKKSCMRYSAFYHQSVKPPLAHHSSVNFNEGSIMGTANCLKCQFVYFSE